MQEKKFPKSAELVPDAVIKMFPYPVLYYNPLTEKITLLNKSEPGFTEIFPLKEEEKEGISFHAVAEKDLVHFKQEWNKCKHLKENEKHSFITVIQTPEKGTCSVKINAVALRQEDGSTGILLTIVTITTEDKITLIEQGPNSLLQEKIAELEKAKSDFLYTATHDLQAPLRKLSTFTDRLFSKIPSEYISETEPYKTKIFACSEEIRILIDNLSLLYETKQKKWFTDACDLNLILKIVMNEMTDLLTKEDAVIQYNALPVIKGDKDQLKVLFRNIFLNALANKKTDEKLLIDVNASEIPVEEIEGTQLQTYKSDKFYKITITNNGTGFSDAQAKSIFKPFFRLQAKTPYSIHGLELAICKNIVENHEGKIHAISNKNIRTQIIIILPSI